MPQTGRYFYQPRPTDEFVAEILHRRRGQTETDFDLYRAAGPEALFVVGNETRRGGGVVTNSHTRYTVAEFLALDLRHRRRMAAVLRARPPRLDPAAAAGVRPRSDRRLTPAAAGE